MRNISKAAFISWNKPMLSSLNLQKKIFGISSALWDIWVQSSEKVIFGRFPGFTIFVKSMAGKKIKNP